MTTTTKNHLDQLTQPPRLGARVALPQQQTQRDGAFLTARQTPSQHNFVRQAAPERAVQPLAPLNGAISPLRVTLGLLTRFPYLPHQLQQSRINLQWVRGVKQERGSQRLSQGSHDELRYVSVSPWRAYLTTIFFRPTCLLSACICIALGGRGAYSLVHIYLFFIFLSPRSVFLFYYAV